MYLSLFNPFVCIVLSNQKELNLYLVWSVFSKPNIVVEPRLEHKP